VATGQRRLLPRAVLVIVIAFGIVAATALMAEAAIVTVQFNELSPRPVNNVLIDGVNLNYVQNGSLSQNATFNFNTGATFQNLTDPVLEGDATGTLVLGFVNPTNLLSFAIARNTFSNSSAVVTYFFAGTSSSRTETVSLAPSSCSGCSGFAEGIFSYSNKYHAVNHVHISFPGATSLQDRFAIDNLTFIQ